MIGPAIAYAAIVVIVWLIGLYGLCDSPPNTGRQAIRYLSKLFWAGLGWPLFVLFGFIVSED